MNTSISSSLRALLFGYKSFRGISCYKVVASFVERFHLRWVLLIFRTWDRPLGLFGSVVILLTQSFNAIESKVNFLLKATQSLVKDYSYLFHFGHRLKSIKFKNYHPAMEGPAVDHFSFFDLTLSKTSLKKRSKVFLHESRVGSITDSLLQSLL